MMAESSTLLIIGNGFDLQCGLKSSYADFFKWLENKVVRNFWITHFTNRMPTINGWIDVEHILLQALKVSRHNMSIIREWGESAEGIIKYGRHGFPYNKPSEAVLFMVNFALDSGSWEFSFDAYWFLEQLNEFEKLFCEYLDSEVASNGNKYIGNAIALLHKILSNEKADIINFNYTNPFVHLKLSVGIGQVTHVHGTYAEENIIIGVDATEKELPLETHIFTKTYRKLAQQDTHKRALPWHVDKIKFYGHSLGKADYSYFQSIFDNYDLYGSDPTDGQSPKNQVDLYFYYTLYEEEKATQIKRDAARSVYELINIYGTSFDNKEKGKNLLHKLLLEGRVHIEFIEKNIDE